MYFCAAYLNWLSSDGKYPENNCVRAYNGGPGGTNVPAAIRYAESVENYKQVRSSLRPGTA